MWIWAYLYPESVRVCGRSVCALGDCMCVRCASVPGKSVCTVYPVSVRVCIWCVLIKPHAWKHHFVYCSALNSFGYKINNRSVDIIWKLHYQTRKCRTNEWKKNLKRKIEENKEATYTKLQEKKTIEVSACMQATDCIRHSCMYWMFTARKWQNEMHRFHSWLMFCRHF